MFEAWLSSGAAYIALVLSVCFFGVIILETGFNLLYNNSRRFRRFINRIAGVKSKPKAH